MHDASGTDGSSGKDIVPLLRQRIAELERQLSAPVSCRMEHVVPAWGLTPAQARVLELTVRGRSNQEIAGELHIQEGTVEAHLTRIFRKSRTASRAELMYRFWSTGSAS